MSRIGQWNAGPMAALVVAWIVASAGALTLWIVSTARSLERSLESAAFAFGATEAAFEVSVLDSWPQLLALYIGIVLLPPAVFLLIWLRQRRARRSRLEISQQAI